MTEAEKLLIERLRDNRVTGFNLTVAACEAADRIEELERELECERMRLVACGVVAMADTPDSAKKVRQMHPDYESASCESVARRVDECISLREKCDALQADNARLVEAITEGLDTYKVPRTARICEALAATPAQSLDALLDPYKARIAQLEAENATLSTDFSNLRAKVFTSGDRRITLKDRTFTVEGDGLLFDNNFDFDACLRVSGDFAGDEKQQYTQMIADALNTVGCGD